MKLNILYSSILTSISSSLLTHPMDVIKVKYQTNNITIKDLIKQINSGGIKILYNGAIPSVIRSSIYVSSKIYTYEYLKSIKQPIFFRDKVLYGMSAGLIGSILGTPFETITVKMQSDIIRYPTLNTTIRHIYMNEGLYGFFNATKYTVIRGMIVTSCQFSIYEQMTHEMNKNKLITNDTKIFVISSITSSLLTAFISNPIDVCKTRKMNKLNSYKIQEIIKTEGIHALWKGSIASCFRQVPLNLIRFSLLEFYKNIL